MVIQTEVLFVNTNLHQSHFHWLVIDVSSTDWSLMFNYIKEQLSTFRLQHLTLRSFRPITKIILQCITEVKSKLNWITLQKIWAMSYFEISKLLFYIGILFFCSTNCQIHECLQFIALKFFKCTGGSTSTDYVNRCIKTFLTNYMWKCCKEQFQDWRFEENFNNEV